MTTVLNQQKYKLSCAEHVIFIYINSNPQYICMSEHIRKVSSGMYTNQAGTVYTFAIRNAIFIFFSPLILAEIYLYCLSDCHSASHGKRGGFGHCRKIV